MVDIPVRTSSKRKDKKIEEFLEFLELEQQKVHLNCRIEQVRKRLKPQTSFTDE